MAAKRTPLPHLALEIERRTGHQIDVSYGRLWSMAVTGRFPATLIGHRWYVLDEDFDATLAVLGVTAPAPASAAA